jgi:cytochrome c5
LEFLVSDGNVSDKEFMTTFGGVMVALFAIFAVCIVAAKLIVGSDRIAVGSEACTLALKEGAEKNPDYTACANKVARIDERIAPIGVAVTDVSMLKKAGAVRVPLKAEEVVAQACAGCHNAGTLGAPKIGDKAAWQARSSAQGGVDGLTASAIKGKNNMPARGGNAELTDEEIKAAVEKMLKDTGV